ncbi:MAG: hypothetical protein JSR09_08585 [Bacteroidetes bacterium]|nr:hypothetical protein [Bacteroidota bacterium]MBS1649749.1 hypothetical protein [Bacteroidota bacterium]
MKKIFTLVMFVGSVFAVKAQQKSNSNSDKKFAIAGGVSIASYSVTGSSSSVMGYGVELEGALGIGGEFQAFAQLGYLNYSKNGSSMGFIPVLVGARYSKQFIGGMGIGYGTFTGGGGSVSGFTFSPQAGYDFGKIEALAHYTSTSLVGGSANQFGVKVLYKF